MSALLENYHRKVSSASAALKHVKPGQKVLVAPFCSEPQELIEAIVNMECPGDVYLYTMNQGSPCLYSKAKASSNLKIRTMLSAAGLRDSFEAGRADYIPMNLSEVPKWIATQNFDVALVQLTPPNDEGYCNLGISVDFVKSAIKNAAYVVAEVNEYMPWTSGETLVSVEDIDAFVMSSRSLLTIPAAEHSGVQRLIGENVTELVPNGATIQVGVGKIADSILFELKSKHSLGVHSGMISDGVASLIEKGVVTNELKAINRGKTVCTSVMGSEWLYRFVNENPSIELYPADYTHHPSTLMKLDNFYAINSALEVDLTGQVNAEQVGKYPIGGVGGQVDFIRGASLSRGGASIIALPSVAKGGQVSRIVPSLKNVTTLKSDITYVVTENGVAKLYGTSIRQRVGQMLNIAHPAFREQLRYKAKELGYI
ncbi:acetyl-CoA hydrolase/transferase family protein [Alicyclobacillus dauci]|uniref:Acetyl-CoA hydrolase n=1 Tax=Alicyclobacillus dauci TaxID=1475485 RepID=A0ABY6Z051_9BACL|nr:acetyl-CoA hydrolase/transferase C-terminal domain-containing protein [Alicyclobacillus dauci]WAH36211.1 acetyl-CoA hydrolase [Alicyclobacillus dauci]